jgi:hypothetical protein
MHLIFRVVALVATICGAQSASAVQTYTNTTITELTVNRAYANFVAVTVTGTPTESVPSCATAGYANWSFTLALTDALGTNMYALLLTAFAQGKPVTLYGTGLCSEQPGLESLSMVQVPSS